jgi:hypothetical protein
MTLDRMRRPGSRLQQRDGPAPVHADDLLSPALRALNRNGRRMRAAAALIGGMLGLLALAASRSGLGVHDARVSGLVLAIALWLVWLVVDFGLAVLRPPDGGQGRDTRDIRDDLPDFVDTESTWRHATQRL